MANSAQARKRARQSVKRRDHNISQKSTTRTAIKKVVAAIRAGEKENANTHFKQAASLLDRLAGRKIIHTNTASRLKSRLNKKIKALA